MCRLRKAYYNARHEAAAQIDEIVGETASEADGSEASVSEKENVHEKDDDVIRCVCGLHKDEGLMIQCDKCMVSPARPPAPGRPSPAVFLPASLPLLPCTPRGGQTQATDRGASAPSGAPDEGGSKLATSRGGRGRE